MNPDPVVIAIIGLALLALCTALLAAIETVVTRMNVVRALRLVEEYEDAPARTTALLWLTEHRARALDAVLVATVLARVATAACATWLVLHLGGGGAAVAAAMAVVVLVSLVLGEVVPRTVVLRHLDAAGLLLARTGKLVVRLAGPVTTAVVVVGRALVPRRHEVSGPHAGDDELRELTDDEEEDDDELEPEERAMIRSIFELGDTLVREVMVPRPDVISVPEGAPLAEVVGVAVDGGYSRLPVHAPEDTGRIVGVVYAKDLLRRLATEPGLNGWTDLTRPPTFVPETKQCDELLRELQADAVHLAVVVDEYGDFVGLVTIEDVLEEIVGEIVDEHDQEEPLIEPLADGRFLIDARLGVDDLNELLGVALPEEGWDTVGGLVFGTLGRVPTEGERIDLDGTGIDVEQLQGRRVAKVVVTPAGDHLAQPPADTAAAHPGGAAGEDAPPPEDPDVAATDGDRGPLDRGP